MKTLSFFNRLQPTIKLNTNIFSNLKNVIRIYMFVRSGTYSSNLHADYYFGDTTYKLKKNIVETKNTINTQHINRTERLNDMYVNRLSLKSNKSYKLNVKRLVQAFKANEKAIETFKAMVNKKNKKPAKKLNNIGKKF